ncbi:MAG: hypothetical protein ACK5XN_08285 [Bacteroidota bacterium]|jgi:hypothetical protein
MRPTTLNLDITLTGAISAGTANTNTASIPANKRVTAVEYSEIANAAGRNYDIRMDDKTGIVQDYSHRLAVCGVVNGNTFLNVPFRDRRHPYSLDGNQNIAIQTRLIDALGGGETIRLRVTFHLVDCA